jgi:DNA helicase-2/ATP-dependent DNA helicase PcrA
VPAQLIEKLNAPGSRSHTVDLFAETHEVREAARRNAFTGKTYNSVEAIRGFFGERGVTPPAVQSKPATPQGEVKAAAPSPPAPPAAKKKVTVGGTIDHPRYGRGTILRREGEGDDAKLTVSFPGYGLKKIVAKYAGLKLES